MEPRVLAAVAVLAAALASPATALGAAVEVTSFQRVQENPKGPPSTYDEYVVRFAAAPGEANLPRVSIGPDGTVTVTDPGAPLTPGQRCTAAGEREVRCRPGAGPLSLTMELGDRDDAVAPGALPAGELTGAVLDGGAGADAIDVPYGIARGGEGDDRLTAGAGDQTLAGGPGADALDGGDGSDALDGGPGRDALAGGPGGDTVTYAGETAPVTVDLAAQGQAGPATEPDAISGIESVTGGSGADVLRGTEAVDRISGGPGDDRLEGRGGDDDLRGETGDDTVEGGPGRDFMNGDSYDLADTGADTLDGGPGADTVRGALGADLLRGGEGDDVVEAPEEARGVEAGPGNDVVQYGTFGYDTPASVWRALTLSCGAGRDRVEGLEAPAAYARDCEVAVLDAEEDLAITTRLRRVRGRLLVPVLFDCEGRRRCPVRVELRDDAGGRSRLIARRRSAPRGRGRHAAFPIGRKLRRALRRPTLEVRYGYSYGRYRLRLPTPSR